LTDWLATCRAAADDLRGVLDELPTRAEREPIVGEGEGGDDTTAIDAAAEQAIVRRLEAARAYADGGSEDRAAVEQAEAEMIDAYLPAELSDSELGELVDAAVAETGATEQREMGTVMAAVMPKVAGRADGKRASAAVRERLAG